MINTEGREYSIIKRVIALFGLIGWMPPMEGQSEQNHKCKVPWPHADRKPAMRFGQVF